MCEDVHMNQRYVFLHNNCLDSVTVTQNSKQGCNPQWATCILSTASSVINSTHLCTTLVAPLLAHWDEIVPRGLQVLLWTCGQQSNSLSKYYFDLLGCITALVLAWTTGAWRGWGWGMGLGVGKGWTYTNLVSLGSPSTPAPPLHPTPFKSVCLDCTWLDSRTAA
jgi:hypothetical protein